MLDRRVFVSIVGLVAAVVGLCGATFSRSSAAAEPKGLMMVVMDPLALPLSCPCVKDYAQRDYDKLAAHLSKRLGVPVSVEFSESLTTAVKTKTNGRADIVIGKQSVVLNQAKANALKLAHVAALTGKDGATTQTGLFVVAAEDKALTVSDLKSHRIIFGSPDADEKHAAAIELLEALDVPVAIASQRETCTACSDGATKIIELHTGGVKAATVISSYAKPLLEGCGTIKKGDLRVVGETDPVPFVAAFVNESLPAERRQAIAQALLAIGEEPKLLAALETKSGFVVPPAKKK